MTETRQQAFENAAGLLRRLGYDAHVRKEWRPRGEPRAVTALVTCAPEMVIGYAIAITAEEPEAHLPVNRAKVARAAPGKAGDPQYAHWADNK